jgi:hypothetical protein
MRYFIATLLLFICGFSSFSANYPTVDQLPVIEELPDPFLMNDGTRVNTNEDWQKRREEIKDMILHYQYGYMPPAPDNLTVEKQSSLKTFNGKAIFQQLLFKMGPNQKVTMHVTVLRPSGDGPFPVIVCNVHDFSGNPIEEEIINRGFALAEYKRTDLDPDEKETIGIAQEVYSNYNWATLSVWAWGGSRVADYLEKQDYVDQDKLIITGHSRGGKTALLCGALDDRFDLVAPNGSGCGGGGCYRNTPDDAESLAQITDPKRFGYWFEDNFAQFAGKENRLPFDQHFMKALVAPRALLTTDAFDDKWANPVGTQHTYMAVQEVFEFLGAEKKSGLHYRPGKHDQNEIDWRALLDFAELQFDGKQPEYDYYKLPFPNEKKRFSWSKPE